MMYGKHISNRPDGSVNLAHLGRVSTIHQNVSNIEASYRDTDRIVQQICDGPVNRRYFGEQGSGMLVDRKMMNDVYDAIEDGWVDVVVMEDVSRCFRNPRWIYAFIQDCVDAKIRVIAPGDNLDTWDENWEVTLGAAVLRHGLHIPDTRRRVRRTATDAFDRGGMVCKIRFGYAKVSHDDARAGKYGPVGLRMRRLDEHTETIQKMRRMVVTENKEYEFIAQWLNDQGIEPGPYVKQSTWEGRLVADFLRDRILCGWRRFRAQLYRTIFGSGEHEREKNPTPCLKYESSLAHMTEAEWEELQDVMDIRANGHGQGKGIKNRRFRIPRSRSITPAQMAVCGPCGEMMHQFGIDVIKCQNATHRAGADQCWNHVQVPCELTRERLVNVLLERVDRHPEGRKVLLDSAWEEMARTRNRSGRRHDDLDRRIKELEVQAKRLVKAIAMTDAMQPVVEELNNVKADLKKAQAQRKKLDEAQADDHLPKTREDLDVDPRDALLALARKSFDFADLMRRIITSFVIRPVQALDTPLVRPRAYITLDLAALVPGAASEPEQIVLDLFEPPVHIKHMPAVLTAKATLPKPSLSRIVDHLRIGRMTVKRALGYAKLMEATGMTQPYRELHEAPAQASRWKARKPKEDAA